MLELLRKRGECSGENFDAMGLLQTLCLVKMDTVDGIKPTGAAAKPDQGKTNTAESPSSSTVTKNSCKHPNSAADDSKMETEMKGGFSDGLKIPFEMKNSNHLDDVRYP